jgi:hypothetical protein
MSTSDRRVGSSIPSSSAVRLGAGALDELDHVVAGESNKAQPDDIVGPA